MNLKYSFTLVSSVKTLFSELLRNFYYLISSKNNKGQIYYLMRKFKNILYLFLGIFILSSCNKDDFEYIEGNTPPPDNTIETVTKENYVNKLYISVLGRQASDAEYEAGLVIVNKNNLSEENRKELVDLVMMNNEYYHNEFETIREDVLNSADTSDFTLFKQIFIDSKETTDDPNLIEAFDYFIERLNLLQAVIPELENQNINFIEVQKRCVLNHFYDDINMGTENFVVSLYQNFLFRYPTASELEAASEMVDGTQSTVFYQLGRSKEDLVDIFLSSNEYIEGQIRTAFLRFLFREPTSEELASMSVAYKADFDFKAMQKRILILDEYVGI